MQKTVMLAAAAVALAACSRSVDVVSDGEVVPATTVVSASASALSAGSTMEVQLNQRLSTEGSKVGDTFTATVVSNVVASNGDIVVPAGAVVSGRINALDDSDDPTDRALIQLQFDRLSFNGRNYNFAANVTNVATVEQRDRTTGKIVQRAATGAAVGAAIGAVIKGPDLENILKGAAIGAAAGSVLSLGLGDVEHVIPAGTRMTIQATQTISLR
jgi:hypothetical protein